MLSLEIKVFVGLYMVELTAFQLKEMNVREIGSIARLEMNVYLQIKLVE